jgi:hypothetical protein
MHEEQWGEIVADWLWEDEKLKKKQRRTNKKMFQDLKAVFVNIVVVFSYFSNFKKCLQSSISIKSTTLRLLAW